MQTSYHLRKTIVATGKAQASVLAWPMIGVSDLTGGCASRYVRSFYPVDHPPAAATVDRRGLLLSPGATVFQPPLSDRSLGHGARVRLLYRGGDGSPLTGR